MPRVFPLFPNYGGWESVFVSPHTTAKRNMPELVMPWVVADGYNYW
jgi:hypothetical protein